MGFLRTGTALALTLIVACSTSSGGGSAASDGGLDAPGDQSASGSGSGSGGSSGSSSGAGGDSGSDGATEAGAGDAAGDGGALKACFDSAAAYCMKLQTCRPFLLTAQFSDEITCASRQALSCLDALQAPGTGSTLANLEACASAVTAVDCNAFLYGKPAPSACLITGQVAVGGACRYDAQCGSGLCHHASGAACGHCATPGSTGAPCTTADDCSGNLLCAGNGTCQPPAPASGACSTTAPCGQGLACLMGTCTMPGVLDATCNPADNGSDCDYSQGLYCGGAPSNYLSYEIVQAGGACGSTAVCMGGGTCFQSVCVAPAQDGAACNPQSGVNCMAPSSCTNGMCSLDPATQCQ
jgi:hypothetical protein